MFVIVGTRVIQRRKAADKYETHDEWHVPNVCALCVWSSELFLETTEDKRGKSDDVRSNDKTHF